MSKKIEYRYLEDGCTQEEFDADPTILVNPIGGGVGAFEAQRRMMEAAKAGSPLVGKTTLRKERKRLLGY